MMINLIRGTVNTITCCKGGCSEIAVSDYHWLAEKFGAAAVSFFCEEHYNERISLDNQAYDEEQAQEKNKRFDRMAALLRLAYPTRIPEEWTR